MSHAGQIFWRFRDVCRLQWVMPGESGLGAPAVDRDRDRGGGGVRMLVVVMNQKVVVST